MITTDPQLMIDMTTIEIQHTKQITVNVLNKKKNKVEMSGDETILQKVIDTYGQKYYAEYAVVITTTCGGTAQEEYEHSYYFAPKNLANHPWIKQLINKQNGNRTYSRDQRKGFKHGK